MSISLDDYQFELPEHLIAQQPAQPRDSAKLLVFDRQTGKITDSVFSEITTFLPNNTTLVLNNAKVDKCRMRFGNMEIFVLESVSDVTVRVLVKPGPKFKLGKTVALTEGISATVMAIDNEGIRTLTFNCPMDDARLEAFKLTPLPPYIAQNEQLAADYQTVYAKEAGSKAAPTAGLHFTAELLKTIRQTHPVAEITLDVGLGTFAPLREESIASGHLHTEHFSISQTTAQILNQAQHLTAVGTTSLRTLESAADQHGHFDPISSNTDIFIQPGYKFKAVDALITNFHLPKTSLLMLVAAFMGYDHMMDCYQHAITNQYRFYSFGDAMLIL